MGRSRRPSLISLFAGAGGLDLAAAAACPGGFAAHVATDMSASALATLSANLPGAATITADAAGLDPAVLLEAAGCRAGRVDLVIGGPPCTPFSMSGNHLPGKLAGTDPDAGLLDHYARIVAQIAPRAFVAENVPALTHANHAARFGRWIEHLSGLGYRVSWQILDAADYGVAQHRRRLFVVGLADRADFTFPAPTHGPGRPAGWVGAADALAEAGAGPGPLVEGRWADLLAEVPPGGNYQWHTSAGGGRDVFVDRSRFHNFLARAHPDLPVRTLQAQPGPWTGPFDWRNAETPAGPRARRFSVAAYAALMGFGPGFVAPSSRRAAIRQLGNAVPVPLGAAVIGAVLDRITPEGRPGTRGAR